MRADTGRVATRFDADNALPAKRAAIEALRNIVIVLNVYWGCKT